MSQTGSSTKQITQSSFTLLISIMGSSILAFPFIVHKLGWVLISILLLHSVLSMLFTMYYYLKASYYTKSYSYKELTMKLLGKRFAMLLDISLLVSYYGFMTSYIIVASRSVVNFVTNNIPSVKISPAIVKIVISVCIIFPLTLLKSLSALSKVSTAGSLVIFIFVFTIIGYFFKGLKSKSLCSYLVDNELYTMHYGLRAFPDTSFGTGLLYLIMYIPAIHGNFGAHPVIPRFLKELVAPYPFKRKIIQTSIIIAISIVLCCLVLAGYIGAAMFGDDTQQNVLQGFGPCKYLWADVLNLLYGFVVIISFPLVLYPLKTSLCSTFKAEIETPKGYRISIIIDVVYISLALLLALFMESIVCIFGLFASISGFFYFFFMPIYCFIISDELAKDQQHLDVLFNTGTPMPVDNVGTAVLSMFAPSLDQKTLERARTFSNKIFGEQEIVIEENGAPVRRNSIKVTVTENGEQRIRTASVVKKDSRRGSAASSAGSVAASVIRQFNSVGVAEESSSQLGDDQVIKIAVDIEQQETRVVPQELEIQSVLDPFPKTTKRRKIIGFSLIGLYGSICVIGVVMNLIDVVNTFK